MSFPIISQFTKKSLYSFLISLLFTELSQFAEGNLFLYRRLKAESLVLISTNLQGARPLQKFQSFFQATSVDCPRRDLSSARKCLSLGRPAIEYRTRVTASLAPRFSGRRHRSLPWRDAPSPCSPHRESITGYRKLILHLCSVTFRH